MKQATIHLLFSTATLALLSFGVVAPHAQSPAITPSTPPASAPASSHLQNEILVAAAADLQFAMDSLIKSFGELNPGIVIRPTYGSSGNFFSQIGNGAPFDIFFSADMDYPRKLEEQHLSFGAVKQYAIGQIVLWSKKIDPAKDEMNTLLNSGIAKIAIANPAHAPYGQRARESLIFYNLFDRVKDRLVLGENISQTAQFVESGAADIGIIALSLARSPAMQRQGGRYWLIPETSHQSLRQGYTLLQHGRDNEGAKKFADFIGTTKAVSILKYFGLGD